MVNDYNLPFGPWGQEQTTEQIKEHSTLCSNFELLCASKHLTDFVEKWGEGNCFVDFIYAQEKGYQIGCIATWCRVPRAGADV